MSSRQMVSEIRKIHTSMECLELEPTPEPTPEKSVKAGIEMFIDDSENVSEEVQRPAKSDMDVVKKEQVKNKGADSKWENFPVEKWRSAVYVNRAYFGQLCTDTTDFIINFAEQIKLSGRRVSLIEVGCGTGEFIRDTADSFRVAVGLDFNLQFIEYCRECIPKGRENKHRYIHGDATRLVAEMEKHFPVKDGLLWNDVRIVACVGNTIGIIPQELKATVYQQMLELAGEDGILIMAYWNAKWFGDAVQNFYHANPQLCGPFIGGSIDISTTTLQTPSGYRTHWTSVEEAREVMERYGAEIISIKDQGKGVLVAARRLPNPQENKLMYGTNIPMQSQASGCWYDEESEEVVLEKDAKPQAGNSKWQEFPVEKWRSAVYINRAYFGRLCTDTTDFIVSFAEKIKARGRRVSLIEVGCGTGEFIRDSAQTFRVAVGLDFNPNFIQYCEESIPKGMEARQRYIHGDACKLVEEMEKHFPKKEGLLWNDVRIVACVGNTIGIIPQDMKAKVYDEMLNLAGEEGIVIMAYWNAQWFGDAVQNFYHANPQLCGPFKGESIDLSTCTLKTPSGYCTHWTSIEEARDVMEGLGVEIISIRDQGKGVLVAARRIPEAKPQYMAAEKSACWYGGMEEDA